jgi:hypothetical protein
MDEGGSDMMAAAVVAGGAGKGEAGLYDEVWTRPRRAIFLGNGVEDRYLLILNYMIRYLKETLYYNFTHVWVLALLLGVPGHGAAKKPQR